MHSVCGEQTKAEDWAPRSSSKSLGSQVWPEPWQGEPQRRFSDLDKGHTLRNTQRSWHILYVHPCIPGSRTTRGTVSETGTWWLEKTITVKALVSCLMERYNETYNLHLKRIGDQRSPSFPMQTLEYLGNKITCLQLERNRIGLTYLMHECII